DDLAALVGDLDQVAVLEAAPRHVADIELDHRFALVRIQARHAAGAAHAVPLVAQAAGGQAQGKARVDDVHGAEVFGRQETRLAVRRGEHAVRVETLLARGFAFTQRPLLRPPVFQHGVVDAADVEVAAARACAVFVEDVFRLAVGEESLRQFRLAQRLSQSVREVDHDLPVGARFPRRGYGLPYPGNPAFGIGDRAFLLAPARGRQDQVAEVGGVGI